MNIDGTGVESLLERISEGSNIEDRRSAVNKLRDTLSIPTNIDARNALATVGIHVVLQVLREKEDVELMVGALEVLVLAVAEEGHNDIKDGSKDDVNDSISSQKINSEVLVQDVNNIELLLDIILNSEEFYLKYNSLQLLTGK